MNGDVGAVVDGDSIGDNSKDRVVDAGIAESMVRVRVGELNVEDMGTGVVEMERVGVVVGNVVNWVGIVS